ncbi:MAG: ATP-binding protein, partial [Methanospirillum sp.]|uniref:ATP-binding protein n=1 Tax=Methanospirillum sp. TaxID=45200 RepID=UPI00236AB8C7
QYITHIVNSGKYFFLSRPRRFGKSLFIDTLDCAFSGRKDLFTGLYLTTPESGWDFEKTYPVLRVDFAGGTLRTPEDLTSRLERLLTQWEEKYATTKTTGSPGERLLYLIPQIAAISNTRVVILIDEYDKPILDNLEDLSLAATMRDLLKDFYGAIKPLDNYLKFVFFTGVSKFVKTGIFSGLNNLNDITIDKRYSAICGYTHQDLVRVFGDRLTGFDINDIARWYNGYSWTGESVYNPFDILLFLDQGVFRPYWFETGTPSFLIKLWKKDPRLPAEYDGLIAGEEIMGSFDPEYIRMETLLFQSGYLTIKNWSSDPVRGLVCILGFPNTEVRTSLNALFSEALIGRTFPSHRNRLYELLDANDIPGIQNFFYALFASIPHDWYRKNKIAEFEGYYASVFYTMFASLGYELLAEDTTNHGRIDLTVKTKQAIWLFEFKVLHMPKLGKVSPLVQMHEKGYADKYQGQGLPVHEIGIIFDPKTRNIVNVEMEK